MSLFSDDFITACFFIFDSIIFAIPVLKFRFNIPKTIMILILTFFCTVALFPDTPTWRFLSGGQDKGVVNVFVMIMPMIIGFCIISGYNLGASLYIFFERHNIGFVTYILRLLLSIFFGFNVWVCAAISYILVLPLLYYFVRTGKKSLRFYSWMEVQRIPFFLLPLLITILMRILMLLIFLSNIWAFILILGLIVLSVFVYFFMNYTAIQSQEAVKLKFVNNQMEFQRERISHFETLQDTIKRQRHDLRHHNTLLLGYLRDGSFDEATKYLEKLQAEIEIDELVSYCDHYMLNLLISVYCARAKKKGIKFFVSVRNVYDLKIEDQDMAVMVSNLIENALEACQRIPETQERYIKIYCSCEDGRLQISIENSCTHNIEFDKQGMPITKKEDGGIGTKSVRYIVKKYGGFLSYSADEGQFVARLVISN